MEELDNLIEIICEGIEENDSLELYQKVMICCCECIKLLNKRLLDDNDIKRLEEGIHFWTEEEYNPKKLRRIRNDTGKTYIKKKEDSKEQYAVQTIFHILKPYEDWEQNIYRPYLLEYFVLNLQETEVDEYILLSIIMNHFPEFI